MSAGVEESFATGPDGTRLYVRQRDRDGDPARSGPGTVTSILCDGVLCDGFIWKYLWDDLARLGRVAHWHYRGHGRSAPPADPDRVDIRAHAEDLDRVRVAVGDGPVVLFGHSMGCQVALEGYRLRREGVRGMVLLCGSYGRVTETFRGTKLLAQALPPLLRMVEARPGLARALWSRVPAGPALKAALFLKEVDVKSIRPDDLLPYLEHMTHVDFHLFVRMLTAAGEHSAEDLLPTIDIPVLVVAGTRDAFTPPVLAEQMVEAMPHAELLMLEEGTHVAPIEQRDAVEARIAKFFAERVAP